MPCRWQHSRLHGRARPTKAARGPSHLPRRSYRTLDLTSWLLPIKTHSDFFSCPTTSLLYLLASPNEPVGRRRRTLPGLTGSPSCVDSRRLLVLATELGRRSASGDALVVRRVERARAETGEVRGRRQTRTSELGGRGGMLGGERGLQARAVVYSGSKSWGLRWMRERWLRWLYPFGDGCLV